MLLFDQENWPESLRSFIKDTKDIALPRVNAAGCRVLAYSMNLWVSTLTQFASIISRTSEKQD